MSFCNINSKKFIAKILFLAGILTIFFSLVTFYMGKDQIKLNPESKFSSPMIELEFSASKLEVLNVIGSSNSRQEIINRKSLNLQNYYDGYFLLSYSFFVIMIFLFFYNSNRYFPYGEMILGVGLSLSLIMLFSDIIENTQIYKLTSSFSENSIKTDTLTKLIISSRVKFTAIFISCMVISCNYLIYCRKSSNIILKTIFTTIAVLYFICGISGYFSIIIKEFNYSIDNSITLLIICWTLTFIHSLLLMLFEDIEKTQF